MKKKLLLITTILCLSMNLFGITNPQISVLICGNGNNLYSLFGHAAIRIKCDTRDVVYNFGTFDFDTPDFGLKFIRGDLNYFLSKNNFNDFLNDYENEKRSVTEYLMIISSTDAIKLEKALEMTYNNDIYRTYKYQFLKDNCSTRVYNLLKDNIHSYNWSLKSYQTTFRSSLNENLNDNPMSRFGINILLGAFGETKLNSTTNSFLPDSLSTELSRVSSNSSGISLLRHAKILFIGSSKVLNSYLLEFLLIIIITFLMVLTNFHSQAIINFFTGSLLVFLMIFSFRDEFMFNYGIFIFNPLDILLIIKIGKYKNYFLLFSILINIIYAFIYEVLNIGYAPLLAIDIIILIYKLRLYTINANIELSKFKSQY